MDKLEWIEFFKGLFDWLNQHELFGYSLVAAAAVFGTYLFWKFYFVKKAVEKEHKALLEGIAERDNELNFYRNRYGQPETRQNSIVVQKNTHSFSRGKFCFIITLLAILICAGFWLYFQHKYTVQADTSDTMKLEAENHSLKIQIASLDNTISLLQEDNTHTVVDDGNDELSEKFEDLQRQLEQERAEKHALELERDALRTEVTRLKTELEKSGHWEDGILEMWQKK